MGSEPVESMNTRGVVLTMLAYRMLRSMEGLSTKRGPRFSMTKFDTACITYRDKRKEYVWNKSMD